MLINFKYLFKKYSFDIKGVIHVGGHHGQELKDYSKYSIKPIHIFEPLKKNFQILKEKTNQFKNLDVNLYNFALGNKNEKVTMNCSSNDLESSSILNPKVHLTQHPDIKFETKEIVEVKKLDSFEIYDANFLNIDVQGYELEVLKGAKNTLKIIDFIYCEVNRDETYQGNPLIEDIDDFLKNFSFFRVETKWASKHLSWGDAFYSKNKNLVKNKSFLDKINLFMR